jgi:hypothetical protein
MTRPLGLLRDWRGGVSVQMIILAGALSLAGLAGVKVLSTSVGARSDCTGTEIRNMSLGGTPCSESTNSSGNAEQPPPPPPPDENGGDDDDPEDFDAGKELLDLLADLIGFTDAKKCVTEGDILACVLTLANFTPGKIFGLGFKIFKNAKKIKNLIDKFFDAKKAKKAEEAAEECTGGKCDKPGVCFAPGTLVHTATGLVAIEELSAGDQVWSRDDQTGDEGFRPIARTFVTLDQPLLALSLEDAGGAVETLEVTAPHPFWIEGRGWVAAGQLQPGDQVAGAGGDLRVVENQATGRTTTVYNFEVEEFHTYFVGAGAAWVHNDCKDKKEEPKPKKDKKTGEKCNGDGDCKRGHCHPLRDGSGSKCVDCTPKEISNFLGIKDRFCKKEPSGCGSLAIDTPLTEFETRVANGNRCIDARVAERDRCFAGGDPGDDGHPKAIVQAETARSLCACLADVVRAAELSFREKQGRARACKQRFRGQPGDPP